MTLSNPFPPKKKHQWLKMACLHSYTLASPTPFYNRCRDASRVRVNVSGKKIWERREKCIISAASFSPYARRTPTTKWNLVCCQKRLLRRRRKTSSLCGDGRSHALLHSAKSIFCTPKGFLKNLLHEKASPPFPPLLSIPYPYYLI